MKKISKLLCCLLLIVAGIFVWARYIEPSQLIVRSVSIEIRQEISPFRAAFFTDTHFGKYYDSKNAQKIAEKINELHPDMVLFGGDLWDNYARDQEILDLEEIREAFSQIEAPQGKFAVLGNHDRGGGAIRIYEEFLESCGFQVLKNETVELSQLGISITGYDDYLLGYTEPSEYTVSDDSFHLLLSHEPIAIQNIETDQDHLMLSGHTHGGQVRLPLITQQILPPGSGNFLKGYYTGEEIAPGSPLQLYVSSGVGMTKYPFRLGNMPEIIDLTVSTQS
ncbi:MAG: metallophosphoesterase [Massiliimalia sp.]|jgi:predicted MPP superfamily phosphohydrolase